MLTIRLLDLTDSELKKVYLKCFISGEKFYHVKINIQSPPQASQRAVL